MLVLLGLALLPGPVGSLSGRSPPVPAADHAVILLYHHVADDTPAATSVRPDRFAEHLAWLADNGYRVLALDDLLERLQAGSPVPDRSVAITFDDAWVSVHDVAAPMLAERGWPFTVFVNTGAVDAGQGPVMTWDQLRALAPLGGAIGSHSASHDHLPARRAGESPDAWRSRIDADLARALARIEQEIGQASRAFAYPYGEDSAALAERVAQVHAFGLVQRSGAVGPGSDFRALPRFPLAVGFDGLDRLERAVRSRPLPVREARATPSDDGIRDHALDHLTLVLGPGDYRADALACYSAGGDSLDLQRPMDAEERIVRITLRGLDRPGRNKINCTAPAADGSGDWYWYSYQWLRPPLE
nr:polysaccharide deacetylase family protein [Wenzhouxiangella sp. XN79A]